MILSTTSLQVTPFHYHTIDFDSMISKYLFWCHKSIGVAFTLIFFVLTDVSILNIYSYKNCN